MKRAAWIAGLAGSLLLLAYFIRFAADTLAREDLGRLWSAGPLVAILGAALLSAAVVGVSAAAWRQLLAGMGEQWRLRPLFVVMATTQLAKYVPGNIAQHFSRVAYALSLGMGPPVLAATLLFETLLLLGAGVAISIGVLVFDARAAAVVDQVSMPWMVAAFVGVGALTALLVWAIPRVQGRLSKVAWARDRFRLDLPAPRPMVLARAAVAYALCYLMLGVGMWLVMRSLGDGPGPGWFYLTGAFALAWLVGFVAPGVPAGIGAREGVLLLLLDGRAADDVVLAGIVAARLASVLGDLLCFLLGLVLSLGGHAKLEK